MHTWLCPLGRWQCHTSWREHVTEEARAYHGVWEAKKETGRGLGPSTHFPDMNATTQIPSGRPHPQRVFTTAQFHHGLGTKPLTHDSLGIYSRSKLWDVCPLYTIPRALWLFPVLLATIIHCWFSRSVVTIGFPDVYVYNWKINVSLKIVKFF